MMLKSKWYILLFLCLIVQQSIAQDLHFNEVQSTNRTTIYDEDKETPDWFELINLSTTQIQLENYRVSDDLNFDSAWVFPQYTIDPGDQIVIFASGKDIKGTQSLQQTLIDQGNEWKYLVPQQTTPNWNKPEFDDSGWNTGQSGFGYSDNDDATIINPLTSIYLRDTFLIDDLSSIQEVLLHMDYDDGFIAYLNGTEIARANLGNVGSSVAYNAYSIVDHEAQLYSGGLPDEFTINNFKDILIEGANLLAVEVHNVNSSSSDFTAIPFFTVTLNKKPDDQHVADFLSQGKNMHTNFKLDADGDSLFLFSPTGQLIDQLFIPASETDISLGYKINDFSKLYAFPLPTPWSANTSEALLFSDSLYVDFSQPGGLYKTAQSISLTTEVSSDTIFYTTDGSEPTKESIRYTTPFQLSGAITIRARVIRHGHLPGKINTNSYYPNSTKSLPIVFISTNPRNLWDINEGIYVKGNNANTDFPYFGANFWNDWEKPAHFELYFPEDERRLNIDGGIKIYGAYSRGQDQKSLSFFARKDYGDKSINCKLFEDKPLEKFEALVLRNSGNDWHGQSAESGSMFRDLLMTKIGLEMQIEAQAGRPVVLILNGTYWGIHNMKEKINEHFLADQMNDDPDKIDLLSINSDILSGNNQHYLNMIDFLKNNDITIQENLDYLNRQMDIDNFIRYNIAQIFYYNGDWPGNNIKYWRPERSGGRWRWILYDTDFGFGIWDLNKVYHNTLDFATTTSGESWPNPPWSTFLLRTILQNTEVKNKFINTFADHLNTTFNAKKVKELIDQKVSMIKNEMQFHIQKWGGNYSSWQNNNTRIKDFADIRPGVMRDHLVNFFDLNGQRNVQLNVTGAETATIRINTIKATEFPWQGIYFDNIPIQLTAIAPEGYRFVKWKGDVNSTSISIKVDIKANKNITAVFEIYHQKEYEGIVINEISYNASPDANSEDWIELYNNSNNYTDLSGWFLVDGDEERRFTFAENTFIKPKSYLVIARNLEAFNEVHPNIQNLTGQLGFGFSSQGECIQLYNTQEVLKDQVCFANEYPWPDGPNGKGYTLSLISADEDNSLGYNWNNSKFMYGTPGGNNQWVTNINVSANKTDSKLMNCFPNPFSKSLYIPVFSIGNEQTKIDILNLNGQIVHTLYNGILPTGTQTIEWNSQEILPGFLLVRMQTADKVQMKKVLKISQ